MASKPQALALSNTNVATIRTILKLREEAKNKLALSDEMMEHLLEGIGSKTLKDSEYLLCKDAGGHYVRLCNSFAESNVAFRAAAVKLWDLKVEKEPNTLPKGYVADIKV